jgi:hypothetical protein
VACDDNGSEWWRSQRMSIRMVRRIKKDRESEKKRREKILPNNEETMEMMNMKSQNKELKG